MVTVVVMKVSADRNKEKYVDVLMKYLKTKDGLSKAMYILHQVFPEFEIDSKGRITSVKVNDTDPIVLEFE
ncbi:MAG: hypothetical protein ACRC9P_02080 [Bacteroides sp.]